MNLPDTWVQVRLDDIVADIQPGFARRPNDDDTGMPQLRTNNVSPDGNIDISEVKYVEATPKELEKYDVLKGDIIFNNTNSLEWVGKTAHFDLEDDYVFSNHMTRIRVDELLVDAEFLARYLHYLWQVGFSRRWAKQWVNQAAIDQTTLPRFPVSLPLLPEQEFVVSVLRQADELRLLRRETSVGTRKLLQAQFQSMFGDCDSSKEYPAEWKIVPLGTVIVDAQYGISTRLEDDDSLNADSVCVMRMNNVTVDGWLDLTDVKCISRDNINLEKYSLRRGDILFNRTNSPDLVGKTGLWEEQDRHYAFASYLIRVRLSSDAVPEYIWALMNSPYGKGQVSRLAKQAVSMANINVKELSSIPIVLPPKSLQAAFARAYAAIRDQLELHQISENRLNTLFQSLLSQAFTGELTEAWRERNAGELHDAAAQRDIALGLRRERPSVIDFKAGRVTQAEQEEFQRRITEQIAPATNSLLDVLKTQLLPLTDLSKQVAFANLAETIQPALSDYSELVNQVLSQSLAALGRSALDGLAQQSQALAEIAQVPLAEAVQQSTQDHYLALARQMAEIAAQMRRQALLAELPQPHRAIHELLDEVSLTLLREARARPAYFRPEDLVDDQISVLEAEEKLHMLETLGLVRRVQVRDQIRYRLVDDKTEQASKKEWIA